MDELKTKIVVEGDAEQASSEFDRLRQDYERMASGLRQGIGKIEAFEKLTEEAYDLETSFKTADTQVRTLRDELIVAAGAFEQSARRAGELKAAIAGIDAFERLGREAAALEGRLTDANASLEKNGLKAQLAARSVAALKTEYDTAKARVAEFSAAFEASGRKSEESGLKLKLAKEELKGLSAEYKAAASASSAAEKAYEKSAAETTALVGALEKARAKAGAAGQALKDAGVDTGKLTSEQQRLKNELAATEQKLAAAPGATKALKDAYREATGEATRLKDALDKKRAALAESSQALKAAGLNVIDLKAKHSALKAALDEASASFAALARVANARDTLGVKPFADIRAEIERLKSAYETLAKSGQATTAELAQAKARLIEKTRELEAQTNGWLQSLEAVKGRAAAALGVLAAELAALAGGWKKNAELAERMAEVFTLFDGPRAKVDALREGVEQLSRRMGVDAVAAARGLYDVISSGVPENNALAVLEQSSRAAIAGITDTATAVKVGLGVINAYGKDISELGRVYDILFQTVKDGVTTFPELAQAIGPVLPVARAAGVSFDEVAAAIATMTKAGIATPQAVTALRGALTALSAPSDEAKQALRGIGIEWNGLVGTLEQIKGKNLGADAMRTILPDVEGRVAVLALTQSFDQLKKSLEGMEQSAGALEKAYDKMEETPEAAMRRLREEFAALSREAGSVADQGLKPLMAGLTELLGAFNGLPKPVKDTAVEVVALGVALGGIMVAWRVLQPALITMAGSMTAVGTAAGGAAVGVTALARAFKLLVVIEVLAHLKSIGEWLGETAGRLVHGKIAAEEFGEASAKAGKEAAAGFDETKGAAAAAALAVSDLNKNRGLEDLTLGARSLVEVFDDVRVKGEAVAKAIEAMFAQANLARPDGIRDLVTAMDALRESGRATEDELKNGLEKRLASLSGTALATFAASAQAAFDEGEEGAQSLSLVLETVLKRAIAGSGQDFAVLTTGIGKGMQDALAHVDLLADNMQALKDMGVDAGRAIEGALVAAFKKVGTQTEFDAVIATMGRLGIEAGKAGREIEDAMIAAKKRADEATPGINSLSEAYRTLGMKSKEELAAAAQTAKEAYDTIKQSGTASAQELRTAFEAYAKAAIAANGGVASEALEIEAAMRGMTIEVDSAGRAIVKMAENTADAAEKAKELAEKEKEAAENTKQQAEAAKAASLDTAGLARQMGVSADATDLFSKKLNELIAAQAGSGRSMQEVVGSATHAAADYAKAMVHIHDLTARIQAAASAGSGDLARLVAEGEAAARVGAQIGEEDLSGLRNALAAAKSQMESLKDSAEDTLSSLEQELAQMNGHYAEAERLRFEARRADLEAQLAIARAQGNVDAANALARALAVLDQVAAKKIAEARQREEEERTRSTHSGSGGGSGASSAGAVARASAGPSGGGGAALRGGVGGEGVGESRRGEGGGESGSGARVVNRTTNIHIAGVLDVNDRATVETLARKLRPVIGDLERRGA